MYRQAALACSLHLHFCVPCYSCPCSALQIVSRRFYQTFVLQGEYIFIVRGSSTSEMWQEVGPAATQAVQSFRLAQA
jgi:hypothetical protein